MNYKFIDKKRGIQKQENLESSSSVPNQYRQIEIDVKIGNEAQNVMKWSSEIFSQG